MRTKESSQFLQLFLETKGVTVPSRFYESIFLYMTREVGFKQPVNSEKTVADSDMIIAPCSGYYTVHKDLDSLKRCIPSQFFYGKELLGFVSEYYSKYKDSTCIALRRSLDVYLNIML